MSGSRFRRMTAFGWWSCMVMAIASPAAESSGYRVVDSRFVPRMNGPRAISGLVHDRGNRYWAVADNGDECGLYALKIDFSAALTAEIAVFESTRPLVLAGARDLEAVAVDGVPGRVWTADEATRRIVAYDVASGAAVAEVPVPAKLQRCRPNLGFESLAIAEGGLEMWTATEEGLPADSPRSGYGTGTVVRLTRFVRESNRGDFRLAGMYAYRTDGWSKRHDFGGIGCRGVADMAIDTDGSLWVLEREMSSTSPGTGLRALMGAALHHTIYRVSRPTAATNVMDLPGLEGQTYRLVDKKRVWSSGGIHANLEAICFAPDDPDGSRRLILASDAGDGQTIAGLITLKLQPVAASAH